MQLHGGQVDGHAQSLKTIPMPLTELLAGLIQYPPRPMPTLMLPFLLGQGNEQVRTGPAPLWMLPANQRLYNTTAVAAIAHLGVDTPDETHVLASAPRRVYFQLLGDCGISAVQAGK